MNKQSRHSRRGHNRKLNDGRIVWVSPSNPRNPSKLNNNGLSELLKLLLLFITLYFCYKEFKQYTLKY